MANAELDQLEDTKGVLMYIGEVCVSFNTWYRWMIGESYTKGYDNFDTLFTRQRVKEEAKCFIEKYGVNIYKKYFNDYILFELYIKNNTPICVETCKYRKMPEDLPPQRNALRVEWSGSGIPRCGARLKYDPYGGYPQYDYCTFNKCQ